MKALSKNQTEPSLSWKLIEFKGKRGGVILDEKSLSI
jgi:hypothetical protein